MSRHKVRSRLSLALITVTAVLLSYGAVVVTRTPSLIVQPSVKTSTVQTTRALALEWPSYGQAAVGASTLGVLATHGSQTPVPIASTAKIMTALAVLKTKPLSLGQAGTPLITLLQADVDIYNSFATKDGSVTLVTAGEQISEYQALQAILLPSANNMADSLAIWAFGSLDAYTTYANRLAAQLGLNDSHFADASGFSPTTRSTARDLITLSLAAMKDPVFARIVGQSSAVIPIVGKTRNRNTLLGQDDIIGIKTGNTAQAGGVFVVAATHHVGGRTLTVVAAVVGAPNLRRSMRDSVPLLASAKSNFVKKTIVKMGTVVGTYPVPWGSPTTLRTTKDLSLVLWGGSSISTTNKVKALHIPGNAGMSVGILVATSGGASAHVPVVTSNSIAGPSLWWRLRYPTYAPN